MALTVTEANAVNTILTGLASMDLDEVGEKFADALILLAHSAYKTLAAGWTRMQVMECWPTVVPDGPAVCTGDAECTTLVDQPGQLCADCRAIAADAGRDAVAEVGA